GFVSVIKDCEIFENVAEKSTRSFHFDFHEVNMMVFGFSTLAVFESIGLEKFVHQFYLMSLAGVATVEADLGLQVFHFRPVLGQATAPVIEQLTDDIDGVR